MRVAEVGEGSKGKHILGKEMGSQEVGGTDPCYMIYSPGPWPPERGEGCSYLPCLSLGSGQLCGLHRPHLIPSIPNSLPWLSEPSHGTWCRKQQDEDAEVGTWKGTQKRVPLESHSSRLMLGIGEIEAHERESDLCQKPISYSGLVGQFLPDSLPSLHDCFPFLRLPTGPSSPSSNYYLLNKPTNLDLAKEQVSYSKCSQLSSGGESRRRHRGRT